MQMLSLTVLLLFLPLPTTSKVSKHTIDTLESFVFLDRFVFFPTPPSEKPSKNNDSQSLEFFEYGLIKFEIDYAEGSMPELLLFYNGFDLYSKMASQDNLSCKERRNLATAKVDLSKLGVVVRDVTRFKFLDRDTVRVTGYTYFTSLYPQWFFVALSNCHDDEVSSSFASTRCRELGYCQGPTLARVSLEMTNGLDVSSKHFSYDQKGVREMFITFFSLQCGMLILCLLIRKRLVALNKYHYTVQIMNLSCLVGWFGYLCNVIHYVSFGEDGIGKVFFFRVGSVCGSIADLLVVYLLVFLGKGWTLVRYKISSGGRMKIAVLITLTLFSSMVLEAWKSYGYSSEILVNQWVSGPGIIYLYIRALIAVWFVYCCLTTIRAFQTKRRFYNRFCTIFTFWLLLKPIMVFVCQITLTDDNRAAYLISWEVAILFCGQAVLLCMYFPGRSFNAGFPFHHVTSVMLGMVQGESPSDFIRNQLLNSGVGGVGVQGQVAEEGGSATTEPKLSRDNINTHNSNSNSNSNNVLRGNNNNGITLGGARSVIKTTGNDISNTLRQISNVGRDLVAVLQDLNDFEEDDVDYVEDGGGRRMTMNSIAE